MKNHPTLLQMDVLEMKNFSCTSFNIDDAYLTRYKVKS